MRRAEHMLGVSISSRMLYQDSGGPLAAGACPPRLRWPVDPAAIEPESEAENCRSGQPGKYSCSLDPCQQQKEAWEDQLELLSTPRDPSVGLFMVGGKS